MKCSRTWESTRESAKECGINLKASFRWLHRFLRLPATLKAILLEGIVEVDETLFAALKKASEHLTENRESEE
jgi:hypothetical protein